MIAAAAARPRWGNLQSALRPAVGLVAWVHIYLLGLLGVWIAVVMVTTGWQPVVVTSGSMSPTLRPGDVLMVENHPGELVGQRSVITFNSTRDPGGSDEPELITHRVFEVLVDSNEYVTKGDANPSVDVDRVSRDQVVGLGRLVVPLIGLPVVWIQQQNHVALVATAILSLASLVVTGSGLRSGGRERHLGSDGLTGMADRAIRRVRLLAGLMIFGQFFMADDRFDIEVLGLARVQLLGLAIISLALVNGISINASKRFSSGLPTRYAIFELCGDTLIVVIMTTATGGSGIGWVLIALPIVEAAVRFRLAGALIHWMAMTGIILTTRLWVLTHSDAAVSGMIDELEQLLDQLGVLLLVVIPGAYLAEQLLADVVLQQQATEEARRRGELLEHVAAVGYQVNTLSGELFDILTSSTLTLGFDAADVCVRLSGTQWRIPASAAIDDGPILPPPDEPGSALGDIDLEDSEVVIDHLDPDPAQYQALSARGLTLLVRFTITQVDGTTIVLRAAKDASAPPPTGGIEALRLLCAQATVALQNRQLITELRDVHSELQHQALHDPLTGLPNRAQFLRRLGQGLAAATDPSRRHAVLFLDLNGFKGINDTLGHEAGDALLQTVGARLTGAVAQAGLVARLGGDEFTVLLEPVASPKEAVDLASSIHRALLEPLRLENGIVKVGASIGIAFAETGLSDSEILRRADAAMYAAKQSTDSLRVALYHPGLDEAERRRGRLAAEFKKALDQDELALHFQPLVSARTGRIEGVEALLRWTHRELGPVNTADILDLAEVSNRVDDLNAWIFQTALQAVAGCNIRPDASFFVAVNVSPVELDSDALVEQRAAMHSCSPACPSPE